MTITSLFMQLVQHIQFIGMLSAIDIAWPNEWFQFTSYFNVINLSFENIIGDPKVPVFSRRMIFMFVSICLPLIINVLLLIIFQPMYVVLWYLCLCIGVVFLSAGLAANFLPSSGVNAAGATDPSFFMIFGGALVGFALLTLLINKLVTMYGAQDDVMAYTEEKKYFRRFHRKRALKHCGIFLFCLLVFLLCARVIVITIPRTSSQQAFDSPLVLVAGIFFGILAGLTLIYMVANWSAKGRRMTQKLEDFGKRNLLLVMLTGVSVSYIPVISYAVSIFMCKEYSCPAGTKFNPFAYRAPESFDTSVSRYCDSCIFNTTSTPACGRNLTAGFTYCPAFTESRSWRSPETTCADEATAYFFIAAAIVLLIYMLGIPLLFLRVIQYLTANVVAHARIGLVDDDETNNDIWNRQMSAIQPVASSLYDPFALNRRYYTLVQLVHRLLITMTITVAAAYSRAAVVFVLILHGVVCVILAVARPYVTFAEQVLAMMLAVCNVLNAIYAIAVWQDSQIPSYSAYIFLVLNGFIPAIGVLVGHLIARRHRQKKATEIEQQRAIRQVQEIEAAKKLKEEGKRAPAQPFGNVANEPMGDVEEQHHHVVHHVTEADIVAMQRNGNEPDEDSYESSDSWVSGEEGDGELDEETKRKVKRIMELRQKHNDRQRAIMDQHSTTTMNKAFMAMGVFFIIALGIAFLGLLRTATSPFLVGSHADHRGADTVFAGYASWDEFTASCCCLQQTTPSPDFVIAERWTCGNAKTVERGRVTKSGDSGLAIRNLCSTSFNDGCTVGDLTASGTITLSCPANVPAVTTTSSNARDLLW